MISYWNGRGSSHLRIPVLVEIVDGSDAATISVGVVHVLDVVRSLPGVAGHHRVGPPADLVLSQVAIVRAAVGRCHDCV